MVVRRHAAQLPIPAHSFPEAVRIYTGILGQIGDILMFTATVRRLKEIFPNSAITFAVSSKYREAGEMVAPTAFIAKNYFERTSNGVVNVS